MDPSRLAPVSLDRMVRAVEKVRERLLRATSALRGAGIPHAVIGGHAVAAWISRVDESAVRNTCDVDILLRREDLGSAIHALEAVDFRHRHASGVDVFLDGSDGKVRNGLHVVFAGEFVRPDHLQRAPDVGEVEPGASFAVIKLDALVRMKLIAFCDKDRMHLRDLLAVGLVDATSCDHLPPDLAERLQRILADPEG